MIVTVVGLGLIGGSVARRLRGFHDCVIRGVDIDRETLVLAQRDGAVHEAYTSGRDAVKGADLVILCLYPERNVSFIRENGMYLKDGAVVTDVSGVKEYVVENIRQYLPENVDFVGAHPMAGRETGGYQSSTDTLFDRASFLITPTPENKPESIALLRELAAHIGCRTVMTTTPREHDEIIAYTSQLMHVVAVALCDNPMIERSASFSAGSLRDCTRVAIINAQMWSELFCENHEALADRIEEMQESLEKIKQAVKNCDRAALEEIMTQATEKKIKYLME